MALAAAHCAGASASHAEARTRRLTLRRGTDPAVAQLEYQVTMPQRARAVRDHQHCPCGPQVSQRLDDLILGAAVERARHLIQDQERSVAIQRAREPQALTLPPGETAAALADRLLVAARQARDALQEARCARDPTAA